MSAEPIACERVSVLIPAYNEEASIAGLVVKAREAGAWLEILVVDDGSADETAAAARRAGARVVRHPYNKGNGAAVKTAVREARGDFVLLMDADGQHAPEDMRRLTAALGDYDLVVGARSWGAQASMARGLGNSVLARLASFLSGFSIPDLTSGFRAARRDRLREFLHLFPNGFSYPTTSTLAFVKAGYNVCFLPIAGRQRDKASRSKMRPWREGGRFLMIILRMITLFSPLRVFVPLSLAVLLAGLAILAYTVWAEMRVTNTSVLLITAAAVLFLFGLLSEQIASLRFAPPSVPRGRRGRSRPRKETPTASEGTDEGAGVAEMGATGRRARG